MIRELERDETSLAHAAMLELRPRIGTEKAFAHLVESVQRPEGYRLVASFAQGKAQSGGDRRISAHPSSSLGTSHLL